MGFFKIQCEITSCPYQEPSKNGGYCNKGIFDKCPQTTRPGNERVKDYHNKRRNKYKK
jgi:hypothetical protein